MGLVCGEGSFTISVIKKSSVRLGFHARTLFQVELHRSDRPLLVATREYFGFGSVMDPKPRTRRKRESPTSRYTVIAGSDCERLVQFFRDRPLLGDKQRSFRVWSQAVEIIQRGRHLGIEGFSKILDLRSQLQPSRRPSTWRTKEEILAEANEVGEGRRVRVWTDEEEDVALRHLAGEIDRRTLNDLLAHRSSASISNKLTRLRKKRNAS